ncbi:MAG TPA: hypothetical protein VML75_07900 [Kofleriaceae bacterium]|nr:hypothetical protein [Kofleriaceae bacterium]
MRAPALPIAVAACLALGSAEARAWWYVEHLEIGTHAYRRACSRVEQRLPDPAATDAASQAIRVRFEIACGNLGVVAEIYGQTNALSGDRLDDPDDFLSRGGDWKVGSRRHYYALQLVDVHHFHPASLREWSRHHREALDRAAAAATHEGLDAINAFQSAFYRNAFADHFLQDSYAAGHMGFNRSASSIAATAVHHDHWNARGRRVRNRAGEAWVTYGDGKLNDPRNAAGRERVIAATAMSSYGLVATFVFGKRDREHELDIWRQLPFLISARPVRGLLDGDDDELPEDYRPIEAISWPARIDRVVDIAVTAIAPADLDGSVVAALIGVDAALPFLATQAHVSAGGISLGEDFAPRFAARLELRRGIGLSLDGLFSHHLSAGFLWEARLDAFAGWGMLAYMVQLEVGRDLLHLQVGPTFDVRDPTLGVFVALGYGRVFGVTGGGIR